MIFVDTFNLAMGLIATVISFIALLWFVFATRRMEDERPKEFFKWVISATFFFFCYVVLHTITEGFFNQTTLETLIDPINFVFAFFAAVAFIKSAFILYNLTLESSSNKPLKPENNSNIENKKR